MSFKTHYKARHREDEKWRSDVILITSNQRPKNPLTKFKLRLVRHSSVCPDYDGLTASFKPVVDGLIYAKIIQDDNYHFTGPWDVSWQKASPRKGFIEVEVSYLEKEN